VTFGCVEVSLLELAELGPAELGVNFGRGALGRTGPGQRLTIERHADLAVAGQQPLGIEFLARTLLDTT
jgi:hypothetical protein